MSERCRSCGAPIRWVKTLNGKSMPVDARIDGSYATFVDGNLDPCKPPRDPLVVAVVTKGEGLLRSHYASCPQADQWRKK